MKPLCLLFLAAVSVAAREKNDLVVGATTLVQRCVLEGVASTRVICVGEPGGFNYAFDAINCAPTVAWSGGFLDFSGETQGRGGSGCKPLGVLQTLGIDPLPLRIGPADQAPASVRFHGYRRDAGTGAPTFLFEVDGVAVEQRIHSKEPGVVSLELTFPAKRPDKIFYCIDPTPHAQVVLGNGLRWSGPKIIEIPPEQGGARIALHLKAADKVFVREAAPVSGAEVFRNLCSACHSTDGTKLIGPTFKGLWGREALVTRNGVAQTVRVDAAYVYESIVKPQAAIVKGYEAVPMADFSAVLTREQIESLIHYIKQMP